MTNTTTLQRLRVVGAFVLLCATPRCFGGDNTWTNSTETSAWNFTDANWTAPTKWSDVNVDGAVFDAGGVGPLTLQESVIARSLAFEVDGYSLVAPYNKGIRLSDGGVGARDPGEIHVAAGTATIDATLVGVVPVKKTGTGRLVLSRNVANSGGILIEEGTLQITGQTFSPPSISGPIVNNATLEFTHPAGLVNAGNVAGTGDLVINGGTDSVLSADDSTYTGDTYIQSGTLEVRTLATPRVYNDAVLSLSTAGQISEKAYSGVISGSGEVRVTGFGTYLLTGNNTYTGVTSVQNAKLIIGDGATSGSVGGSIGMYGDGCAVEFRRADDVVFNGSIGGSGQFIKYGSGKLTVLGNLIVTGAGAIVDEGTLIVTDGWSPHPLVGGTFAANAGAVLRFERTIDSEGYGYFITGTGQFEKAGPATMSLLEPWSFAGQTVVEAGTLRFANKSQFYLHGDIVNDGNVVFAGASQYDGVMSGSGNVTIERFESITFRGSNSYTGVTTIPARTTLSLEGPNGAIVGDVAVDG
ncbi:MAG: autotransporter-associated beta strand repeat-containing protein, partial [Planctomycetales bacterium]|nr:autotransporter-associated beta strand repeat-containing protein [Planctomycetales bacterium]